MFFNFFKTPEVRKFEHTPIYWDPKKEEQEERRERIHQQVAQEMGQETNGRPTLRRGFLSEQRKAKAGEEKGSTLRLALMITLLAGLLFWIMK